MSGLVQVIIFIVISEAIGIGGSIFTVASIPTWYAKLKKPSFNPPNWIFGPVWTILYALLGISAFLVWEKGWNNSNVQLALAIFAVQFILNFAWSAIFFRLHKTLIALVEIMVLWIFILLTILAFYPISQVAGLVLIPYLLWVSFATLLNFYIWKLN